MMAWEFWAVWWVWVVFGVALEKSFGALTPHIEVYGSENIDTGVNLGLRGDITKSIQLDGSVGRQEGVSIWAVRSTDIVASDPAEADSLFEPARDKVYRHPTFYDIPDEVKTL